MAEHVRSSYDESTGFRLSWGGIFAGLVLATVTQIILSLVGLAVGFGALNFGSGQSLEGLGIGAGIWAVVSALISLFLGGLTAGHLAGVLTRVDGALHGILVWGLSIIVTLWALSAGVGALVGGAFGAVGQTISGAVGQGAAVAPALATVGSREEMVQTLQQQTDMSQQEAEEAADALQQARTEVGEQAQAVRRRAPQVAGDVAETLSTAAWWALLAALLSLAAAAGGAALTAEE